MGASYKGAVQGPILAVGTPPFAKGWQQSPVVATCPHLVWEHVLVTTTDGRGNEVCIRCKFCQAPRCGHSTDVDPCMLVRHHRIPREHAPFSTIIGVIPDLNDRSAVEQWLDE